MNEIERLFAEDGPRPPAAFEARVMRAVRREAAAPAPIPFPWLRFALGLAAGLLLIGATVIAAWSGELVTLGDLLATSPRAGAWLAAGSVGLVITWAAVRWSRFASAA